jgi:hypothetical protein
MPADIGRGEPEQWRMSGPLDRGWVEAQFDLGPLAWWFVAASGGWVLADSLTHATLCGSGEHVAHDPGAAVARATDRPRLGHVADDPELQRRWPVPSPGDELAVLAGTPLPVRGPNVARSVRFGDGVTVAPAVDRVAEVLRVVLPRLHERADVPAVADALPDWFVAACAPRRRTPDEWRTWAREAYADASTIRFHRWEARWTVGVWLDAMVPAERTWWLADVDVVGDSLRLSILTCQHGALLGPLSWLLHVAGAMDCHPRDVPAAEPLVVSVKPPQNRRDPDDDLAAVAHEVLGLPDPLVLRSLARRGGRRWEHHTDVPIDVEALERALLAESSVRYSANRREVSVSNGWSTVSGPRAVPAVVPKKRWWRR